MLGSKFIHITPRRLRTTSSAVFSFSGQLRSVLPSARVMLGATLQSQAASCSSKGKCALSTLSSISFRPHSITQGTGLGPPAQLRCQHTALMLCTARHAHARAALVSNVSTTRHQPVAVQSLPLPTVPSQATPNTAHNSATEGRRSLQRRIPVEIFRIAGVSFEARQEQVAKLQLGQALMLVKEPNNEFDPDAIAVHTLSGLSLGYVPRDFNNKFPHDANFARVHSVAPAANEELLGVLVAVQPSLPPLTLEAFPANLASHINMSTALPQQTYDTIRKETYRIARFRCEVTGGVGPQWPVECHELWRFHDDSCTLQLTGFTALHPGVHAAKHLERQRAVQQRHQALQMLQAINGWTGAEAEEYWNFARDTAIARSRDQWKFDLSWLSDHGFETPQHLQTLCQ